MKCIKASSERWSGHPGRLGFERTDVASSEVFKPGRGEKMR